MQIKFQTRQTTILFILKQMYVIRTCSKYDIARVIVTVNGTGSDLFFEIPVILQWCSNNN